MPELTREEKLKLVEKLPQQLQDLLYSEDTGAFLLYLGQKYNLSDEKVRLLSKLVGDVILGIVPITSLAQEINSKITSNPQAAMNLAQELNTELLAPAMMPIPSVAPPAVSKVEPPTTPIPAKPVDEYREPPSSVPEVVDLRKPPPISAPALTPKPTIPTPAAAPLIEAEPHEAPAPESRPQYIMRPSGAPPTDLPENVLDLRKDRGEF